MCIDCLLTALGDDDVCAVQVMLAEFYETDTDPPVKWIDGVTHIRDEEKSTPPAKLLSVVLSSSRADRVFRHAVLY